MSATETSNEVVVIDGIRYRGKPHDGKNRRERRAQGAFSKKVSRPAKANPMPVAKGKFSEGSALLAICQACYGRGRVPVILNPVDVLQGSALLAICQACYGRGRVSVQYVYGIQDHWCDRCGGTGKVRKGRS